MLDILGGFRVSLYLCHEFHILVMIMSKISLNIDAAVYEFCLHEWTRLTGMSPERVVSSISRDGSVAIVEDKVLADKLNTFLQRVDRFVPRVRLDVDGGAVYAAQCHTLISRWRRHLASVRSSLLGSGKVVYLADAVNTIIAKPVSDEIARLRKSISSETDPERVDVIHSQIAELRGKLRKLPRCTNSILTVMLHEVIDRMSQDDAVALAAESSSAERYKILRKYYDHLRPEIVADALVSAPYTFWAAFDMNQSMTEVTVSISSPRKSTRRISPAAADEKSVTSSKKKQPTLQERAEALMSFPYHIISPSAEKFKEALEADIAVMDEYDSFTKAFKGLSLTPEYRAKYAEFCRRFRTIPDSALAALDQEPVHVQPREKDAAPIPATSPVGADNNMAGSDAQYARNEKELIEFLTYKAGNDQRGLNAIQEQQNQQAIRKFARQKDFPVIFESLRKSADNIRYMTHLLREMRQTIESRS